MRTITYRQKDRLWYFYEAMTYPPKSHWDDAPFISSEDRHLSVKQLVDALRLVPVSWVASMERAEELADLSDEYLSKTLFSLVKELGPDIVSDMLEHFCQCFLTNKSIYNSPCLAVSDGPEELARAA
jgi:hypothetical protein